MTTPPAEHPTLGLHVTEAERQEAGRRLRWAYDSGRLSPQDFDRRSGIVALATTRRDLNTAFLGLVQVAQPRLRPQSLGGVLTAHLAAFFCFLLGPLIVFFAATGADTRREAAKAFNLSFLVTVAGVVVTLLTIVTGGAAAVLFPVLGGYWSLSVLVMLVQALQGIDWNHPLKRWLPWELLRER